MLLGTEINGDQDLIRFHLCDGFEGSPTCNFNFYRCFVEGCRLNDVAEQMSYFTTSVPCPDKPKLRHSPYVLAMNAFAHSCCSLIIFMTFGTHGKYKAIWASILKKYFMRDKEALLNRPGTVASSSPANAKGGTGSSEATAKSGDSASSEESSRSYDYD